MARTFTLFLGTQELAAGPIEEVVRTAHHQAPKATQALLVFDDTNGRQIDLDLSGDAVDALNRLSAHPVLGPLVSPPPRKRGRPKLGVVSREISLLPRHWEWLSAQPRSTSATLRQLIEAQMDDKKDAAQRRQSAVYGVMSVLAGDLPGFEEASRALFAQELDRFGEFVDAWPADIKGYLTRLQTI